MARPWRIERAKGRYHVIARGNERKAIYRDDTDRFHFLELLGQMGERFGLQVHAYVLMDNHFHLLLQTPEANLSRAMQWLNVSYSVWFNRRHDRVGHLFQGRFGAVVVEDDAGWQEVARYVHLNPVRVGAMKLDKARRRAAKLGAGPAPTPELIGQRLEWLRTWRWSSYRAYAGYERGPDWLEREPVGRLCGGRSREERQRGLREYTEAAVRQGMSERPWDRLVGGLVLGSEAFAQALRGSARGHSQEQTEFRRLAGQVDWERIVGAVEQVKGQKWEVFWQQHGDWGRDAALWLGRKHGRLTLGELGQRAGAMKPVAVSQALRRFGRRLEGEAKLRRIISGIEKEM